MASLDVSIHLKNYASQSEMIYFICLNHFTFIIAFRNLFYAFFSILLLYSILFNLLLGFSSLSIFRSFKYLSSFDLMRLQVSKTCIRESLLTVKLTD